MDLHSNLRSADNMMTDTSGSGSGYDTQESSNHRRLKDWHIIVTACAVGVFVLLCLSLTCLVSL